MCPEDIRPVNKKEKMVDNLTDRDYNKSHWTVLYYYNKEDNRNGTDF